MHTWDSRRWPSQCGVEERCRARERIHLLYGGIPASLSLTSME